MADQKLVDLLRQGPEVWNRWRTRNPEAWGVDLFGADLPGTDLRGMSLSRANLIGANLPGVVLRGTDLSGANLSEANLRGADLVGADLSGADLSGVNLSGADLSGAIVARTNLEQANVGWTILGAVDLRDVIGLETVRHEGPSTIGIDTIYRSQGKIPETFLRQAGVPELFTTFMSSLVGEPIQFYSCFISHASEDGAFSDRLRSDLLANNVSCWHYRHDMRGGRFWRTQINEAIKVHDKLVLICSKDGLQERNVVDEIVAAMERERETGAQKLFPIRLDDFILSDEMLRLADERMDAGQWREDWVRHVRAYHIPDFSLWKTDHDAYQAEFGKLLDALKNPARR